MEDYCEGKEFTGANNTNICLPKGTYENCRFINCIFTGTDLSGYVFIDCQFEVCDLSLTKLKGTAFRDIEFNHCKMLGLHYDDCNPFLLSFNFDDCNLELSSFFRLKLKKVRFKDCKLHEVDFVEANLTGAVFLNCDFARAVFDNTILDAADFRTAFNFSINPETNSVNKAKFSSQNIAGLLDKYNLMIE